MQFAYSQVQFKTVDADARIIEGIASTPAPDRQGDLMDSKGAQFSLPMPLLWQHKADKPIGWVRTATVSESGIRIRAHIAKGVADFIEEAWALIKAGLVPGLSIGWLPIEGKPVPQGFRYTKWGWHELSAVTIPMNADATITAIKSADAVHRAESGTRSRAAFTRPDVSGKPTQKDSAMNYSERRQAAQGELTQKTADLEGLMALDTLTDEQTTERDALTSEIDRLTSTVKSLSVLERVSETKAEPVAGRKQAPIGGGQQQVTVEEPKLPPGVGFARMVLCKAASQFAGMRGEFAPATQFAKAWYPHSERTQLLVKTAVAPAVTTDSAWAGALVYNETIADFVEYLRPRTVIGQFGQNGIPSLNRVPFNMRQITESAAMTGYWVGQGKPKPVTKGGYTAGTLGFAKVAAITIDSEELLKFANHPTISAEEAMRNGLTKALVAKIDSSFIDPSFAAVSNVNPASITNGVSAGSPSGTNADAVRADVQTLLANFIDPAANMDVSNIVLILPPALALSLSLMRTSVGVSEFPNITMRGGSLQGIPVVVSNYAALAGVGNMVIAVVASEINLADDGQVQVDLSREASLEFNDAPTQSGTAGVSLISLWQNNLVAFRAERFINWGLRRPGVVAYMDNVLWGGAGSPS